MEEQPGKDITFLVSSADSFQDIAAKLQEKGVIRDRYSFLARAGIMDTDRNKIYAGKYILNNSMTYEQVINHLTVSEGFDK